MLPLSNGFRATVRCAWFLLLGIVILGSLAPANSAPIMALGKLEINDKVQHFLAYLPLAMLPMLTETRRRATICVALMVLLGIALEFGQLLSPGRDFDMRDALADSAGLLSGIFVAFAVQRIIRNAALRSD